MTLCFETLSTYARTWFDIFLGDAGRYVITAGVIWLVLWVVFAGPLRNRKIRPDRPALRQLLSEFGFSMRTAVIFSFGGFLIYLMAMAGWLRTDDAVALGWAWGVPCLVLMILVHDAYFYWAHRLLHQPGLFRWGHRRHHRSHNPSPFTAYSFDTAEAVLLALFMPLWLLAVPTTWEVVALFMLHQIVRNVIGHSGYEIFPARADGKPLFGWMTTVTHHDLHHAQAGWNYGLYFSWWDRWMGTEHPDYHARFAEVVGRRKSAQASGSLPAAILLIIGLSVVVPSGGHAESPGIFGAWATPGVGSVVTIAPCKDRPGTACGSIVWLLEPEDQNGRRRLDVANPDEASRKNPLVGTLILQHFQETARGVWVDGAVYNPDDGRSYSGTIRLTALGRLELKGCALGIFCKTQEWRRPRDIIDELAGLEIW